MATWRPFLCALLFSAPLLVDSADAHADDYHTLVSGAGVSVSALDLKYELQMLDEERRQRALSSPEELQAVAANIYLRRRMERLAYELGLADDDLLQARLRMQRERQFARSVPQHIARQRALSEEELLQRARAYYEDNLDEFTPKEQIRAGHIMLKAPSSEDRERRRPEAEALLERLHAGEDFGDLASEYSEDHTGMMRGDLGYFTRGRMDPAFEEAVFALEEPGDGTGVVHTRFGLHIIQLWERVPVEPHPFESVQSRLMARLQREHQEQALADWLQNEAVSRPDFVDEAALRAVADAFGGKDHD